MPFITPGSCSNPSLKLNRRDVSWTGWSVIRSVSFDAKLTKWKGKRVKMAKEAEALAIQKALETVPYSVSKITQQEKQRHPLPPFITSRLQQEAYRKLSLPAQKTMRIAQT